MCGIVGLLSKDLKCPDDRILLRMTDSLAHRGPDGEGIYIDYGIGLGHRRLSILDLTNAGQQPMISNDKRYVIVFNGEIYNYKELKTELVSLGYSFRSRTDTEVLLYAYIEWGEDALKRLNGMFAFAVWDTIRKKLFFARDRYGIKPLYYFDSPNCFLFASEIKAIIVHPEAEVSIDLQGLMEYMTFQNFFTDKTLFNRIHLLPPATWIKFSFEYGNWIKTSEQYWDYNFVDSEFDADEREIEEELNRLFEQAVTRQLVSDVDVGAYLSGGMDSGSITAIAARVFPYIRSFTCGFDLRSASGIEIGFDERTNAEYMSYLFKTMHYEAVIKSGDMERVMDSLMWHLEEPRVGQCYPNYYISQLASKFVKVVLAGTGGDELFGGYPWRYYRAVNNKGFDDYVDKYYAFWQRLIPQDNYKNFFKPIHNSIDISQGKEIFRDVFKNNQQKIDRPEDYINQSLYFEAKTFLHGLFVIEDKISMAHGLETRVPFLDNDLVDFAMKVPVKYKLGKLNEVVSINENEAGNKTEKYYQKTRDGKLILRKAMEQYIPRDITDAIKQGFSAPDASWFKGDSIEFVKRTICTKNARIYNYFDYATVNALIDEHLNGKQNRRLLIWSLLSVESFLGQFMR